jgi:hypothetical protein
LIGVLKHAGIHLAALGSAIERRSECSVGSTCCKDYKAA